MYYVLPPKIIVLFRKSLIALCLLLIGLLSFTTRSAAQACPPPTGVTASPVSACLGNPVTLSATIPSGTTTINWYTVPTGGTAIATTTSASTTYTPPAAGTYTFYAEAASGSGGGGPGTPQNFSFTGAVQSVLLQPGTYTLECWGPNGGGSQGGKGGYSTGTLTLGSATTMYVVVGGPGGTGGIPADINGGYNGGGPRPTPGGATRGSGAGATHIATATGLLSTLSTNQSAVKIVAGGGGGGSNAGAGFGYGGGLSGQSSNGANPGLGGTQTAGGAAGAGTSGSPGTFGQGGQSLEFAGAGGGGWYGGGAGGGTATTGNTSNGGGGGSSYIGGVTSGTTFMFGTTGFVTNPDATGNGYARITPLSSGCVSTRVATAVVTVNPAPSTVITPGGATAFCNGSTVQLCAPAAPTGSTYTYVWRNGGTPITPAQTGQCYTTGASGTFTVTVTNSATTCSATTPVATTVTVGLPPAPVSAAGPTTICQGDSVRLRTNNSTGLTYQWSNATGPIAGAIDSVYIAKVSGTYSVTVTAGSAACASTSAPVMVTVNPTPFVGITASNAPTTFCQGGSVVLTGLPAGFNYQWRIGGVAAPAPNNGQTYTASTAGSYTALVTNATTGCAALSNAIAVVVNALPAATISPATATICAGNSTTLSANTGTGLSYQWFNGASLISGASTATYAATTGGIYSVRVTNGNGCFATSGNATVNVNAAPVTTVNPTGAASLCSGDTLTLLGPTGTGYTYLWRLGTATAPGISNAKDYKAVAAGSYTVTVTLNTCTATSAATVVSVLPKPTATMSPTAATAACDSVILSSSNTGVSYQWRFNGNDITNATAATYAAKASGNYSLRVTATNGCSATTAAATAVTIYQAPVSVISYSSPTEFCAGGGVVLNTGSGANLTYSWRKNNVVIPGAFLPSYSASEAGAYSAFVQNTITGCGGLSEQVNVVVHQLPAAKVTYDQATNTLSTGANYVAYQWYRNTQPIAGATQPGYQPASNGAYALSVTDTNGCAGLSDYKFVSALGIGNEHVLGAVTVYPNPTTGVVKIEYPAAVEVILQDIQGRIIPVAVSANQCNISALADGMYLIRILDNTGKLLKNDKIMKVSNR